MSTLPRRWTLGGWIRISIAVGVLGLLFAPGAAALSPGCSQSAQTVICTYTSGSNAFTVPVGVHSIHVLAIGGMGVLLCGGLVALGIVVAFPDFQPYNSPDGKFRVDFPGTPTSYTHKLADGTYQISPDQVFH